MRDLTAMDGVNPRFRAMSVMLFVGYALLAQGEWARADAAAGEQVFAQCAGCHAVGPGAGHRFGPHLNGLMERGAAAAEGYAYSDPLAAKAAAGMTWNEQELDAYLEAPMEYIPGTKMVYPGLKDDAARANVIAYLASIPSGGAKDEEIAQAPGSADTDSDQMSTSETMPESRPLARDVDIPEHGVLHLGRPALDEEVAAWDIDVRPDGMGLPVGRGSVIDGTELYDVQCASCHGVFGEGEGRWPILAGGQDTLTEERPEKTVGSYWPYLSTVYDYIKRAMPFGNARSLSDDDVYALTAYLLYLNDLVEEDFELSSENFASIQLPNQENFIADTRAEEPWFEAAVEPCMTDCIEGEATVSMRARILDVTPDGESDDSAGAVLD